MRHWLDRVSDRFRYLIGAPYEEPRTTPASTAPIIPHSPALSHTSTGSQRIAQELPVYPPFDQGIETHPLDEIVASQTALITRIRLLAATGDEVFKTRYMEPIRKLAATVHLLPASEHGTHCGAGGLFRLALETSFYALQRSESTIFAAHLDTEDRRHLEPRWRYAAWLAGLCCEMHRPVGALVVTTSDGAKWPPYEATLHEWLTRAHIKRYFVRWLPDGAAPGGHGAAATLAQQIIPLHALQYLHERSNEIVPVLFDVITQVNSSSILARLIQDVRERVYARDRASSPRNYGRASVGQHIEPHILSIMRHLLESGRWVINRKKGRIWLSNEGLFLVWKHAAKDVLGEIDAQQLQGMPRDTQTLLEILCAAGIFDTGLQGNPYWTIYPGPNALSAVRFTNQDAMLSVLDVEPKPIETLTSPADPSSDTAAPIRDGAAVTNAATPAAALDTADAPSPALTDTVVQAPSVAAAVVTSQPTATKRVPAQPPARPTSTSGAALQPKRKPVPPTRKGTGAIPEQLLQGFDPVIVEMLKAFATDWASGAMASAAILRPEGLALTKEGVESYGISIMDAVSALYGKGWLYSDPNDPARKLFTIDIHGITSRGLIIRTVVARDAGFI